MTGISTEIWRLGMKMSATAKSRASCDFAGMLAQLG